MIIGGFDRHLDLGNLTKAVTSTADIKKLLLVGQSRQRVAKDLEGNEYKNFEILDSDNIGEIVKQAQSLATNGDSVVLSPGFASFDMFKNFEDRGNQYKQTVMSL